MRVVFIALFSLFLLSNCTRQKNNYSEEIKKFQQELNEHYADSVSSPLTPEDLVTFQGLDFFDIDKTYSVIADFELTPDTPIFEMPTTTERRPLYRKYGIATFTLAGQEHSLSLYQNQQLMISLEYENHLFLPFNDQTNGHSSYGGGRFIDLEIPEENSQTIVIDFNKAYNPYCAYNNKYSCPIPPRENELAVSINAGVKVKEHH